MTNTELFADIMSKALATIVVAMAAKAVGLILRTAKRSASVEAPPSPGDQSPSLPVDVWDYRFGEPDMSDFLALHPLVRR